MSDTAPEPTERPYHASLTVPSRVESIRLAAQFIVEAARSLHVPPAAEPLFEVAIVEALTNAVKHGNRARPDGSILCELEMIDRRFSVRIVDEGAGFHLTSSVSPREWLAGDVDSIPASGHGLRIIQAVFPIVRTLVHDHGFGLEMALTISPGAARPASSGS